MSLPTTTHTTQTKHVERQITSVSLEIENIELQATVDSQGELITRITEDLNNVQRARDYTSEIEIMGREQICMDLKEQLEGKELTIQHLKNELASSQSITEEVYKKYQRYKILIFKHDFVLKLR